MPFFGFAMRAPNPLLRFLPVVLAIACISALLILFGQMASESDAQLPAETHTITLTLKEDQWLPESRDVVAREGDVLVLTVNSDRDVELHLHGYDLTLVGHADSPGVLRVPLIHTGRFGLEEHGSRGHHGDLAVISVLPR